MDSKQAAVEHGLAQIQDIIYHLSYLREAGRFRQIEEVFNKHLRGLNPAAVEQAVLEGELKERMEWWRTRWEKECAALADARVAIREAATWAKNSHAVVEGQHRHYDGYSIDCAACQWLALPAVSPGPQGAPPAHS